MAGRPFDWNWEGFMVLNVYTADKKKLTGHKVNETELAHEVINLVNQFGFSLLAISFPISWIILPPLTFLSF